MNLSAGHGDPVPRPEVQSPAEQAMRKQIDTTLSAIRAAVVALNLLPLSALQAPALAEPALASSPIAAAHVTQARKPINPPRQPISRISPLGVTIASAE
jgi:hypothetical protein